MNTAYPDFLIMPDASDRFVLLAQARQEAAPRLTADLCQVFENYRAAQSDGARQQVVEQFLSAIGNTVFTVGGSLLPETFMMQLRHQGDIRSDRGEVSSPFLGDLVVTLMRAGEYGDLLPVTRSNLDVLGMGQKEGIALAIQNVAGWAKQVTRDFDEDWPGLAFVSAPWGSPSARVYRDAISDQGLPDGAYFICDNARYIYTSARDEVAMATLVAYQRNLMQTSDRPISESLLIRHKGTWHVASLAQLAQAA